MKARKMGVIVASATALSLLTAVPSSAGSQVYFYGDLKQYVAKGSPGLTTTGGVTSLGSTALTAVNQGMQYGYVFATATGKQVAYLTHPARSSSENWCWWTADRSYDYAIKVEGKVNYN